MQRIIPTTAAIIFIRSGKRNTGIRHRELNNSESRIPFIPPYPVLKIITCSRVEKIKYRPRALRLKAGLLFPAFKCIDHLPVKCNKSPVTGKPMNRIRTENEFLSYLLRFPRSDEPETQWSVPFC